MPPTFTDLPPELRWKIVRYLEMHPTFQLAQFNDPSTRHQFSKQKAIEDILLRTGSRWRLLLAPDHFNRYPWVMNSTWAGRKLGTKTPFTDVTPRFTAVELAHVTQLEIVWSGFARPKHSKSPDNDFFRNNWSTDVVGDEAYLIEESLRHLNQTTSLVVSHFPGLRRVRILRDRIHAPQKRSHEERLMWVFCTLLRGLPAFRLLEVDTAILGLSAPGRLTDLKDLVVADVWLNMGPARLRLNVDRPQVQVVAWDMGGPFYTGKPNRHGYGH